MWPAKKSDEERARRVKKTFQDILELAQSPKWNTRQQDLFTKQIFEFFERNEQQKKDLAGIEWSDYTRFPRTQKGSLMAVECFIEDLEEAYSND